MDNNNAVTRRKAIVALGAVAVGSTVPSIGSAKSPENDEEKFRKLIAIANRIGEKQGAERRQQFLRTHGVKSTKANVVAPMMGPAEETKKTTKSPLKSSIV